MSIDRSTNLTYRNIGQSLEVYPHIRGGREENQTTLSKADRDSNLDLPVIGSLVYRKSSAAIEAGDCYSYRKHGNTVGAHIPLRDYCDMARSILVLYSQHIVAKGSTHTPAVSLTHAGGHARTPSEKHRTLGDRVVVQRPHDVPLPYLLYRGCLIFPLSQLVHPAYIYIFREEKNDGQTKTHEERKRGMVMPWSVFWQVLLLLCCLSLDSLGSGVEHATDNSTIVTGLEDDGTCKCKEISVGKMSCQATCMAPPSTDNTNISVLEIRSSTLVGLRVGTLSAWTSLKAITIEDNYHLVEIEPGTFRGMNLVTNLSISSNINLSYLSEGVFEGLDSLVTLQLKKNNFSAFQSFVAALSPKYLPWLRKLILNENPLQRVEVEDLAALNGSLLEDLHLVSCQLEYVQPESLNTLTHLRALYLGLNTLNVSLLAGLIGELTTSGIPLRILNLYSVGLQSSIPENLLNAIADSDITHLSLARNQFQSLRPGSFPIMPHLLHLDLREIVAINFPQGILNGTVAPNLTTLLFGGNRLPGIVPGILLPHLQSLDLSSNSGDSRDRSYFDLGEGMFVNMTSLSYLNLSYNYVRTISRKTFKGLTNLDKALSLKNATIVHIEPYSFSELENLQFLNLEDNIFPSFINLTSSLFKGLMNLKVLLLGGCGIPSLSKDPNVFSPLARLEYLGLERNLLVTLSPQLFSPLPNLLGVDLSTNLIVPWKDEEERVFKNVSTSLQVFMQDNKLTYISPAMIEDFLDVELIKLSGNPFTCDCRYFYRTKLWLGVSNLSLTSLRTTQSSLKCYSPDKWREKPLLEYLDKLDLEETICRFVINPDSDSIFAWIITPIVILMIFLLVFLILGYKYRSYIRYWVFLANVNMRRHGFKARRKIQEGYSNYQYDAFVSYSNEDRNFVVRLVAMLENYEPFLKLCVYERDFEIGSVISESILQSVAMSRRIVLIVSDAFVRSQWCMWELQLAGNKKMFLEGGEKRRLSLRGREDPLVLVRLGQVADTHMTPFLKYLLKTRVYLEWDHEPKRQRQFWDRLRTTLSPPSISISPGPTN
uniref:TIR domain-containing protein n=1 Tax=Timema bartmani TaxID=61472 RepID=A0A7R9EVV3_9NEOP|nr:unnamed protein product [Timema bartmani]